MLLQKERYQAWLGWLLWMSWRFAFSVIALSIFSFCDGLL
jgi:hypothetical protein